MLLNGRARDQIFFAKLGFDPARGEVLFCTVSLDAARSAGNAGLGVEGESILNGQCKIAVAAGRDKSLLVGGCHGLIITRHLCTWRRLSPGESSDNRDNYFGEVAREPVLGVFSPNLVLYQPLCYGEWLR